MCASHDLCVLKSHSSEQACDAEGAGRAAASALRLGRAAGALQADVRDAEEDPAVLHSPPPPSPSY
jgi:hypothetical protein